MIEIGIDVEDRAAMADAADRDALLACLGDIVAENTVYRVKGFVSLEGKPMRLVVHGVGKRFDSYFDRPWRADEKRASHLVFIGHDLDEAAIRAQLAASPVGAL